MSSTTLNQLIQNSAWIGKVRVVNVDIKGKKQIATAIVENRLKGKEIDTIKYYSSTNWTCFTSDAYLDEKCILFFKDIRKINTIISGCRGKFTIIDSNRIEYFKQLYDVILPYELFEQCIADTIIEKGSKKIRRYSQVNLLFEYIHNFMEKPGQSIWDNFVPMNIFEWDEYANKASNLSEDENRTVFDGELNNNTTTRILTFMIGSPQKTSTTDKFEFWMYWNSRGIHCFKIKDKVVIERLECPQNTKWIKYKNDNAKKNTAYNSGKPQCQQ